ncbi:MAG: rplI [Chlamydiia bacterium]|nr:rplI [Chlamydiia bacterium]
MATQLLLLQDVDHLGRKGDVVNTKPGFAYNFLIPKGVAVVATKATLRRQVKLKDERLKIAEQDRKEAEEMASRLQGETISFTVKVDHEGHMYGSVSTLDIIDLVKMQTGIELDKRFIGLKHPIKETGVFAITLRLKEDITCEIHVKVIPEQHVA